MRLACKLSWDLSTWNWKCCWAAKFLNKSRSQFDEMILNWNAAKMVYVRLAAQQRALRIIGFTLCYITPWVVFLYTIFSVAEASSVFLVLEIRELQESSHSNAFWIPHHSVNQANVPNENANVYTILGWLRGTDQLCLWGTFFECKER